MRAFRVNVLIAFDENESPELEALPEGSPTPPPATFNKIKKWLKDAMLVDVKVEEEGDPHGFQSMEVVFSSLEELHPDTVKRLYKV